jgi:hypothetical protein
MCLEVSELLGLVLWISRASKGKRAFCQSELAKRTLMSLITETGRVPLDTVWCGPGSHCCRKNGSTGSQCVA